MVAGNRVPWVREVMSVFVFDCVLLIFQKPGILLSVGQENRAKTLHTHQTLSVSAPFCLIFCWCFVCVVSTHMNCFTFTVTLKLWLEDAVRSSNRRPSSWSDQRMAGSLLLATVGTPWGKGPDLFTAGPRCDSCIEMLEMVVSSDGCSLILAHWTLTRFLVPEKNNSNL